MITTINEWKNLLNENIESNSFSYMVTQHIGKYEEGVNDRVEDYQEFLELACSVLLGTMSADEIKANNLHVYIQGDMGDTEISGGDKLVDLDRYALLLNLDRDALLLILENNYEDYIYDLEEGDEIILSTTIDSEEDLT